jgi:hypothetical protein
MHWISQICKITNCYMCTLNLNWLHACTKTLLCQIWVFINERVPKFIALIFIYYVFIDVLVALTQNLIFLRWPPPPFTSLFFLVGPRKNHQPPLLIKNERSLINWQQYSRDLWPLSLKAKRSCIICWQIAQIIKNAIRLILDNFCIIGFLFFGRTPVDSSHFSLHFDNILSPKAPKYFILNVLNWRPTEECSVL